MREIFLMKRFPRFQAGLYEYVWGVSEHFIARPMPETGSVANFCVE